MKGHEENTARKERRKQVKKSQFPEKSIKFRVGEKVEGGRWKAEGRRQKAEGGRRKVLVQFFI